MMAVARDRRVLWLAAACLAGAAVIAWGEVDQPPDGYPGLALPYLPAAFGGVVVSLALAQGLAGQGRIGPLLAAVGRRTMPVFVMHILIVAGVRIVLLRLGVGSAALVVSVALAAGVVLPIIACALAERMRLAIWLGWARPGAEMR